MTKELKLSRERSKVSPTLTPHGAKSVPYEMFKTEMDAKNTAYLFILSNNLLDRFQTFCQNYKGSETHQDCINQLYYLSLNK